MGLFTMSRIFLHVQIWKKGFQHETGGCLPSGGVCLRDGLPQCMLGYTEHACENITCRNFVADGNDDLHKWKISTGKDVSF